MFTMELAGATYRQSDAGLYRVADQNRLPMRRLIQNLRRFVRKFSSRDVISRAAVSAKKNVPLGDKQESRRNHRNAHDLTACDICEYHCEVTMCHGLAGQILELLSAVDRRDIKCHNLASSDLRNKIARELLATSEYEPCGIRGCVLFISIKEKSRCRYIGEIECDPSLVPTFELYLTLTEDTRPWVMAKSIMNSFKWLVTKGESSCSKLIHPDFQLTKRKLHRPN